MEIKGLEIKDSGERNFITIDPDTPFQRSRILISGNNNHITIGKALLYNKLIINFKGDDKLVEILPSTKNINGLKLVSIRGNRQVVKIGNNFSCGGLEIQMNDGNETCTIGDNGLFSWGIKIRTSDGHSVIDLATDQAINLPKDVHIGNRVWVGEDVSILKGATIAQDCVVGSCAVVTKKFKQPNCVIAGLPASIVKENIKWDRRKPIDYNSR